MLDRKQLGPAIIHNMSDDYNNKGKNGKKTNSN